MIDRITRQDIDRLATTRGDDLISIYLPMQKAGDATQQNPIRMKNQLQRVAQELEGRGYETDRINALLEDASKLVPDHQYWLYQSDGLAVFISPQRTDVYRLPVPFNESATISDRFYLKPLLRLLAGDGRFYVLALSQNEVRLLRGSRFSVQELNLPSDVPENLPTMLRMQGVGGWRQTRFTSVSRESGHAQSSAASQSTGGGERSTFSSAYGIEEDKDQRVVEFFQLIDDAVRQIIGDDEAPLVTAGVEHTNALYREANNYRHLLDETITGSPEQLSNDVLHQKAWQIVGPRFEQAMNKARDDYQILKPRGQATSDLAEIVPAAAFQRVGTLWVATGQRTWGTFDPESGLVHVDDGSTPENHDLLDYAATQTLANSGTVYVVEPEEMPDGDSIAAIMRY